MAVVTPRYRPCRQTSLSKKSFHNTNIKFTKTCPQLAASRQSAIGKQKKIRINKLSASGRIRSTRPKHFLARLDKHCNAMAEQAQPSSTKSTTTKKTILRAISPKRATKSVNRHHEKKRKTIELLRTIQSISSVEYFVMSVQETSPALPLLESLIKPQQPQLDIFRPAKVYVPKTGALLGGDSMWAYADFDPTFEVLSPIFAKSEEPTQPEQPKSFELVQKMENITSPYSFGAPSLYVPINQRLRGADSKFAYAGFDPSFISPHLKDDPKQYKDALESHYETEQAALAAEICENSDPQPQPQWYNQNFATAFSTEITKHRRSSAERQMRIEQDRKDVGMEDVNTSQQLVLTVTDADMKDYDTYINPMFVVPHHQPQPQPQQLALPVVPHIEDSVMADVQTTTVTTSVIPTAFSTSISNLFMQVTTRSSVEMPMLPPLHPFSSTFASHRTPIGVAGSSDLQSGFKIPDPRPLSAFASAQAVTQPARAPWADANDTAPNSAVRKCVPPPSARRVGPMNLSLVQQVDTVAGLSQVKSNEGSDNAVANHMPPQFHHIDLSAAQTCSPSTLSPPSTPSNVKRTARGDAKYENRNVNIGTPKTLGASNTTPSLVGIPTSPFTPINTPTPAPRPQQSLRLKLQNKASKIEKRDNRQKFLHSVPAEWP